MGKKHKIEKIEGDLSGLEVQKTRNDLYTLFAIAGAVIAVFVIIKVFSIDDKYFSDLGQWLTGVLNVKL